MLKEAVDSSPSTKNLFDVRGKVVVITGGLGQLGRQFARALHERGAKVAVFDNKRNQSKSNGVSAPRASQNGIRVFRVDVTKKRSIEGALKKVKVLWSDVDTLINNAGIDAPPHANAETNGPLEKYSEAAWDSVLDVNLKGAFLCAQTIGAHMARAKGGSIINISSVYGMVSPDQRSIQYL